MWKKSNNQILSAAVGWHIILVDNEEYNTSFTEYYKLWQLPSDSAAVESGDVLGGGLVKLRYGCFLVAVGWGQESPRDRWGGDTGRRLTWYLHHLASFNLTRDYLSFHLPWGNCNGKWNLYNSIPMVGFLKKCYLQGAKRPWNEIVCVSEIFVPGTLFLPDL